MNKVFLTGRLTKDPEIRTTQSGTAVGRYSLAVETGYGENRQTNFFDCVTFNKTAQFVEKYLKKGMKIFISGELQQRSYQNREGKNVSVVEILVQEHEFAESRVNTEAQTGPAPERRKPAPDNDGFMMIPDDVSDEELPFN
jgi:single-strand DNA-binding protein